MKINTLRFRLNHKCSDLVPKTIPFGTILVPNQVKDFSKILPKSDFSFTYKSDFSFTCFFPKLSTKSITAWAAKSCKDLLVHSLILDNEK